MAGMIPRSNSSTGTSVGGGIPDAPDNRLYLRTRGAWIESMQAYYRGVFVDKQGLISAHPSDIYGAFAVVLDTGTFWIWSAAGWVDTEKNASGVGIEEAPADDFGYLRKNKNWVRASSGGVGVGKHAELPDLLPDGITGDAANHITDAQLEFIKDYVERRPVRPTNLSPVDGELEVGERARFESTPYLHPFNLVMAGYQLVVKHGETIVYDSGDLDMISVIFQIPEGILQESTEYTWQVRYKGSNLQWSEWSQETSFRTQVVFGEQEIDQPSLIIPQQGALQNDPFAVGVTTPFDPTGGLVQAPGLFEVATSPEFDTIVDSGRGLNVWFGSVELTRGQNYFMRVQHEATNGAKSKKSPVRTFSVRTYFREQRIGIVCVDPVNQVYKRVNEKLQPINIDSEYWMAHAVWAGLEASRNGGANTIVDGQEMVILPAFYINSGVVPSGPFAGMYYRMIDPIPPTTDDLNEGWHMHDAFNSPIGGFQDHVKISAHRIRDVGGVAVSTGAGTAYYDTFTNVTNKIMARNTDNDNILKRGWHMFNCYEWFAVNLLRLIEFLEVPDMLANISVPYRGFNFYTDTYLALFGIKINTVLVPGTWNTWASLNPTFSPNTNGRVTGFRDGDHLFPISDGKVNGRGGVLNSAVSNANYGFSALLNNKPGGYGGGMFGWDTANEASVHPYGNALMSKWD